MIPETDHFPTSNSMIFWNIWSAKMDPRNELLLALFETPILQKSGSRAGGSAIIRVRSLPKTIKKSIKRCFKKGMWKQTLKFDFRRHFAVQNPRQMHPQTRPRRLRKTSEKKVHGTRQDSAQISRKPSPCCLHPTMYLPSYLISTPLSI